MGRYSLVSLASLIDLDAQLRCDDPVNDRELRARDRAIGRELVSLRDRPARQVLAWLERITDASAELPGRKADTALRMAAFLLWAAGFVLGWASALAVFFYDGRHPVNVVRVLSIYVVLQAILLLLTAITFLPGSLGLQNALRVLSPGRMILVFARLLPQRFREAGNLALGFGDAHQRVYGRLQKWVLLAAAQGFAVMFNLGAIAGALQLIVFTDLAFGWSTTLQVEERDFQHITDFVSVPWAPFWSDARPSYDLVHKTRYFRAQQQLAMGDDKLLKEFGRWWPFLIASMVFYGLLPRSVLLGLAKWRAYAALKHSLIHVPGASRLLDRMNQAHVHWSGAEKGDQAESASTAESAEFPLLDRADVVINWAGFPISDATLQDHTRAAIVLHAGGAADLEEDRHVVELTRQHIATLERGTVAVVVRSWEPAMLEFVDFLRQLRTALGDGRALVTLPAAEQKGQFCEPLPRDREQWRRALAKVGDPWLSIGRLDGELPR